MSDIKLLDVYDKTPQNVKDSFSNNTRSELSVSTNFNKVEASYEWLELMENTVRYIDNVLRNPNRFIINEEEIVKVELARRITVDSIRHLSKHTNYIQKIEDNGDVKPSKILNINKDESYNTYENRLVFTLINNMRDYLEIKKKGLAKASSVKDTKKATYSAKTRVGNENVLVEMSYTSALADKDELQGESPLEERIAKLDGDIQMLTGSNLYQTLHKAHVAKVIPPIKKTNVILKNTNFQYIMKLWDFLQSNPPDDTKVIKQKREFQDTGILKEYMDSTFLLNYLAMNTLSETKSAVENKELVSEVTDKLIQKIVELNPNMPITELKEKIGDKLVMTRYKYEASLSEVNGVFSRRIKAYLEKVENMEM